MNSEIWHSTTIIGVRRNGKVALASGGQITMGETAWCLGAFVVELRFRPPCRVVVSSGLGG